MKRKEEPSPSRWQIRVLSGPTQGASRVLVGSLDIGRDADADLRLGSSVISRRHARIISDAQGRHVLIDLSSRNGTFVDEQRIDQHVLRPRTSFFIGDVELVYEPAHEGTKDDVTPIPDDLPSVCTTDRWSRAPSSESDDPGTWSPPDHELSDAEGRVLEFDDPDGVTYPGRLLDDITEYRSLRAQNLRGGFADPCLRGRFEHLRARLQNVAGPDSAPSFRVCYRFSCWFPARLRLANGQEHPCRVRDFGVDGAQLVIEGHALHPDTIGWLTVETFERGNRRVMVFAGRVAWTDDEFVGLAFAGAARRVHGRYAEQRPGADGREPLHAP